ncbi:MAG: transposase, partial [Planctomycetes bacterium]|nr:transposase [Planctomycetota bacterium]MBI3833486.1 transposase [Planctomycetota bacterium]
MPDNRNKRPMPAVMDVAMFHGKFGTDEACWEHLRIRRWGPDLERFVCPDCGHTKGWWLGHRRLV